jgi:DNA invertase Pin-like site-specific DNA recombinase
MGTTIYISTAYTNPLLRVQQVAQCKQLAARDGYHVDQIVADTESDGQQERPGMHHLRTLIEHGGIDRLIVVDEQYLAQQSDEMNDLLAVCQFHNVQLHAVNQANAILAECSVGV